MRTTHTRRDFLTTMWLASAAALLPTRPALAGEVLETKTVRIAKSPGGTTIGTGVYGESDCWAPEFLANELLSSEGFTDIRYVDITEAHVRRADAAGSEALSDMIAHGEVDFGRTFAPGFVLGMNAGAPVMVLSGLHLGCFEVFGKNEIRTLGDLKGGTVGVDIYKLSQNRALLAIMIGLVGLDPVKDIRWVSDPSLQPKDLFMEGKIDAFLASPPELQEVRAKNIGHVIVSSINDRPWSQYYCCMLATSTEFARKYPVATKRALRAILKAADLCASDPRRAAQLMVDGGYAARYDYTLQALSEIRYDVWRDFDPEDSLRFYALRLHEAGLIKATPEKLIAEHTDWRFLNELKRELKA